MVKDTAPWFPAPVEGAAVLNYLIKRMEMRAEHDGLTGISSDAMVLACFTGEGPWITDYPRDRADWRRCLLAYALAPPMLRERMRPMMREYRRRLDVKYRRFGALKFPRSDFLSRAAVSHAHDGETT